MYRKYYPHIAELSEDEVAKQAPFGAKWRLLAQVEVRCYILISNISGSVKVAPLQILQFPVILPHKFQDAEKFNLQFSDFSEITETADKLRWLRYQKGLRQRDVADYAGIYRSTYIHYEEYGKDFYSPKHMEKIASFTIDHIKLQPGVYVSRKDAVGDSTVTTFDLRMTSPNDEPVMNTAEVHTIEHLGATFLRNDAEYASKTVYFGPMGCRTGFYLLLAGDYTSKDIVPLMIRMFEFIRDFKGEVPGASPKDCGNYLDMNLGMANYLADRYLNNVLYHIDDAHLNYPA